jgi:hypothetical protein
MINKPTNNTVLYEWGKIRLTQSVMNNYVNQHGRLIDSFKTNYASIVGRVQRNITAFKRDMVASNKNTITGKKRVQLRRDVIEGDVSTMNSIILLDLQVKRKAKQIMEISLIKDLEYLSNYYALIGGVQPKNLITKNNRNGR